MTDSKTGKCAHSSCNCNQAKDSKYCCTLCEGNEGRVDIICNCGHPACAMVAETGGIGRYGD